MRGRKNESRKEQKPVGPRKRKNEKKREREKKKANWRGMRKNRFCDEAGEYS